MGQLLESLSLPEDLKKLDMGQLKDLAREIRDKIVEVTSRKGGHLAASLGAVDIAVALHYCLESPKDSIIWDVGHQSYAHKILTGRLKGFDTLREMGGLSGFPNREESEHDPFTSGHSATSISSALGMAAARDLKAGKETIVAVIGDASLATGLAFEAMNHAGHMQTRMIVVLNDNEQSISKPVGAMSRYLNNLIANPMYNKVRDEAEKIVHSIPKLGPVAVKTVKKFQEGIKNLLVPGILFEELGFRYFGPIDGHDIEQMVSMIKNIRSLEVPVFIHAITKKGKGYKFSESDPVAFHGVSRFDIETGDMGGNDEKTFTASFTRKVMELAEKNKNIVAITAAMPEGTGLQAFEEKYPERFFDVGITEPHAVTFAAGLARGGLLPIVAVYSTFLQRSYDQLVHDIALQKLPVIFCLDRAGLVGKDGPTHHGVFDIAYTRTLPGFIVMAPKDGRELEAMMEKAVEWKKPAVIRYPRANAESRVSPASCAPLDIGTSERLRKGKDLTMIAVGSMVNNALLAAEVLSREGIEAEVINARFIKPLDGKILGEAARSSKKIFVIEEGVLSGGFGSAVLEFFKREKLHNVDVSCLSLPDEFVEHGSRDELLRKYHLAPDEIAATIRMELKG